MINWKLALVFSKGLSTTVFFVICTQWQFFYNWQRPHGSLKGETPSEIVSELGEKTPFSDEVFKNYNLNNERIQIANYQADLAIRKLKGCL